VSPGPGPLLDRLLRLCVERGASDLHVTAGEPVVLRSLGRLERLDLPAPSAADTEAMSLELLDEGQRRAFAEERTIDLALSLDLPGGQQARLRINVFRERGRAALAIRRLEERIRTINELRLPSALGDLTELEEGLVLFVGPTGSGKSTSLATLIDRINHSRDVHVLTLEDPIEYVHRSDRALIRQRQLHSDFPAFASALRATLREDPDVILVGEMRDTDTLRIALTAAETGHLVFSTLHAGSAVGAAERFVGAFADHERDSVRSQLSHVLRAVVSQRLLPTRDGQGRVPAVELLLVTPAVSNLIRSGKPAQVYSAMESGASLGMRTFEASLAELVLGGLVSEERARRAARDPRQLEERLRQARIGRVRVVGRS